MKLIIKIACIAVLWSQVLTAQAATVTKVAAGVSHSLFVMSDGSLWGMGDNTYGQLGDGTTNAALLPKMIVANGVTAVGTGGRTSYFMKSNGSLWATGWNAYGTIGDGTTNDVFSPKQIFAGGISAFACGAVHCLVVKSDGSLWGTGYNLEGELGNGTNNIEYSFKKIVASGVTAVATGYSHSLFVKADGSLWGMGSNGYGALGDGATNEAGINLPIQIVSGGVTAISGGFDFSLFTTCSGSLWGMGENLAGELGMSSIYYFYAPLGIIPADVRAISASVGNHALFLKGDGSLWGMGQNRYGELGDGTTNNAYRPENILSSNVVAVAGGVFFSLFIKADGSLWAMGNNDSGQLGDGTTGEQHVPEQIFPIVLPINGGFESGTFAGWDLGGNATALYVYGTNFFGVHSGNYGALLGPNGSPGFLSQTVPTTAGASYLLSCWLNSADGATPNEFSVSWNGITLFDQVNIGAIGWTNLQFVVTATNASSILQFGIQDNPSFFGLDDVQLAPIGQPGIHSIKVSGSDLTLDGVNGVSSGTYHILTSTNLAEPISQWRAIATNVLNTSGDFTLKATNVVSPGVPRSYYTIKLQ